MDKILFALGIIVIWFYGFFLGITTCKAEELYAIGTLRSYHQDRAANYNEKNGGIGLEAHFEHDVKVVGGEYKNSFRNKSNYYGVAWQPLHAGDVKAGLLAVKVSGYLEPKSKYALGAVPFVTWEYKQLLVNFVFLPPLFNQGLVAIQIGWNLTP